MSDIGKALHIAEECGEDYHRDDGPITQGDALTVLADEVRRLRAELAAAKAELSRLEKLIKCREEIWRGDMKACAEARACLEEARAECARAVEKYHAEIKRGREACNGIVKIAVAEARRPLVEVLQYARRMVRLDPDQVQQKIDEFLRGQENKQ